MSASSVHQFRLFVCDALLEGEAEHELIAGGRKIAAVATAPRYDLVEIRTGAGLVEGGRHAVQGELYEIDYATLAACDKKRDHPALFHRADVELEDGGVAHAYFLRPDQVRGLRRIRGGSYRDRLHKPAPPSVRDDSPFLRWARSRHDK
jgi:gamma-glutamylaminecyclotransferase